MTTSTTATAAGLAEASDVPANARRRGLGFKLGVFLALTAAAAAGYHYGRLALFTETTSNAYLVGHVHRISANVAGPLIQVVAQDNQVVKKGDLLAQIDSREFDIMEKRTVAAGAQAQAKKLEADARAASARAADLQAQAMVITAEADIHGVEAQLDLAKSVLTRNETLYGKGIHAVSDAEVDQNRSAVKNAQAALAAAKAKLEAARAAQDSAKSAVQAAEADIVSAKAEIDVQKAVIDEVERQKGFTQIVAPADGRIGAKNAETGNRVQIGQALFAVVEPNYWIVANFKETQLKDMRVGQAVDISVDALGGRHFTGKVESFSPATGAQFALLPPDNATGNFTKVVQRVPVKIVFDAASVRGFEEALRPGLSTSVRVDVR